MLNDVCALIYAGEDKPDLRELVLSRSVAALPVGGRYRAIDFLLSGLVNSGIRNVGIITQKNYKSLIDHLGSGKEWDLSRKTDGLFLLPPFDTRSDSHLYHDICDAVYSKLDYLHHAPQPYCLLSGSHTVYSADYQQLMKVHLENNADISMMYNAEPIKEGKSDGAVMLDVDEQGRVRAIEYESNNMGSTARGMDVYLMSKALLEHLVREADVHSRHRFVPDVLIPALPNLRVHALQHSGYVCRLHSVSDYYQLNMDLLKEDVRRSLFYTGRPVYTRIKDEPPVRYTEQAQADNCLMGDGCELYGAVSDSVLFRSVVVGRGARVKNCIIMHGSAIGEDCELENVIIDKYVRVRKGVRLVGAPDFPVIIRKGAVI